MFHGEKICCAILAGGKAERLPDKPFILLNGKPLVSYALDSADMRFDEILVIAKKEQEERLEQLVKGKKQMKVAIENSSDFSPWNGIRTAVRNTGADWILLLACDMPFINVKLFDLLISKIRPDIDCIIPRTDRLQPLCALYRRTALEVCWMRTETFSGAAENLKDFRAHRNPQEVSIFEGSVTRFAESLKNEVVQIPEEKVFWLFNINTKEDFEKAERILQSGSNRHPPFCQ